jgi:3-phenylpropionate/trans-cinnamate dioxygenase ferredoxin subunit
MMTSAPASDLTPVCAEEDLVPGRPVRVLVAGRPVLVVRDEEGAVRAVDDTCTHAEISLTDGFVEGQTVECWAHGARFDLATGAALTLPASEPLRVLHTQTREGVVYVAAGPSHPERD